MRSADPSGVILYDKPAGVSSHDVVVAVRRQGGREKPAGARTTGTVQVGQGERGIEHAGGKVKVGHAGTLDPFATGLLLVLVGRATRVQRFLMALPKSYEAVARFGAVSSTGDPEGEITETGLVPEGDLELPKGRLMQRPPAYSAIKLSGRRAYALARAGVPVEMAMREVYVHRFEERWRRGERRAFAIECSSGTYVRSLIADLGEAYCEELRRTRIGPFDVADADPERVVPLAEALAFLPEVRLDAENARRAAYGQKIPGKADGPGRLTDELGLIALAEPLGDCLRPVVGFR
ncbi:MAG: tRNA pseudouridine(55) synthase TruB [Actinomycetota bacterium]|nr:tRNA pseudouridine(55) synthase TruB [Actinomycetota bacterium]